MRLLYAFIGCAVLATSGCGLIPVPYVADVSGPITGLRVVDMQDGRDIAGARASFRTGVAQANWLAAWPARLGATRNAENTDAPDDAVLTRDESGVFPVSKLHGLGFVRPFGIGPLGWALYNPPIGIVEVTAAGYPKAELIYYAARKPEPGWNETAAVYTESAERDDESADDVRCTFDADGILWFYLRRESIEPSGETLAGQPST